jgi:hypothetical protein
MRLVDISDMLGDVLVQIVVDKFDASISFYSPSKVWKMFHAQDCCEQVYIEEIIGDLDDLLWSPILLAERRTQKDSSQTSGIGMWTFYELATNKGSVTFRWRGASNGYYSVDVYISCTQEESILSAHERLRAAALIESNRKAN